MRFVLCLFFCFFVRLTSAAPASEPTFTLSNISIGNFAAIVFGDALHVPYMLSPDVVGDVRLVSFRSPMSGLTPFLVTFFERLGYVYSIDHGVHSVVKKLTDLPLPDALKKLEVYRPVHRSAAYLNQILRPAFSSSVSTVAGLQNAEKGLATAVPGTAAALIDSPADVVVLRDVESRLIEIAAFLKKVDVPLPDVDVQALVFEYTRSKGDGSALSVAGSLLGGRAGVSLPGINSGSSFTLSVGGLDIIASSLDSDSRYKLVSRPSLRVRSGTQSVITVGQDVPVVGSVVVPTAGAPIRSIEYKTAGTTMKITPTVRQSGSIDVDLTQTLSNAFATDTGVNESPTISRREIVSSLTVKQGESVVVGGLIENKATSSKRRVFGFTFSDGKVADDVEYLVFLSLKVTQ